MENQLLHGSFGALCVLRQTHGVDAIPAFRPRLELSVWQVALGFGALSGLAESEQPWRAKHLFARGVCLRATEGTAARRNGGQRTAIRGHASK